MTIALLVHMFLAVRRSPTPPSPILSMGEGGGAFLVKRISVSGRDSRDVREKRDG